MEAHKVHKPTAGSCWGWSVVTLEVNWTRVHLEANRDRLKKLISVQFVFYTPAFSWVNSEPHKRLGPNSGLVIVDQRFRCENILDFYTIANISSSPVQCCEACRKLNVMWTTNPYCEEKSAELNKMSVNVNSPICPTKEIQLNGRNHRRRTDGRWELGGIVQEGQTGSSESVHKSQKYWEPWDTTLSTDEEQSH